METLQDIWLDLSKQGYETDKGSVHAYLPIYEEILAPYRHTALNVLEIGLFNGHSLRMWERYFTMANVHGIDCNEQPHGGMADLTPMIASGKHNIHILDATNEEQIEKEFGDTKWDLVWDDSSHDILAQIEAINIFKNRINKGGMMIVEDIQNIDKDRWIFEAMKGDFTVEIIDLRAVKRRYDDCLVILKNNL